MRKTASNKKYSSWIISTIIVTIITIIFIATITIYIDPLFHYHAPLEEYEYPLNDERYQNDGIVRNFTYDSIITGTSMTQNFKTSEADDIFEAKFIKVPFSGGRYKEINDNLKRAYDGKRNIKYVIRCLDYSMLTEDKDAMREDSEYPTYLYNNNPFDDVNYVLNKSILFSNTLGVIYYTIRGNTTTSFDDYVNWNDRFTFGKDAVLASYTPEKKTEIPQVLSDIERTIVFENIQQNVTKLAELHPETTFYLFFPPYSIVYWDKMNDLGKINWIIDAEQIAIEEILKYSNIKLYSFNNNFELITDLNNYKDYYHYGEWVNSRILRWMHDDEYRLTENNYKDYLETVRRFYNSYNYDSLR